MESPVSRIEEDLPHGTPKGNLTLRRRVTTLAMFASVLFAGASVAQAVNLVQDKIVNPDPENFTPNVQDGRVNAMVQIGNRVIAVGKFTKVNVTGGATITRNSIFAFNATTGAIDNTFVPDVGAKEVFDVVDAGDGTVYIGGLFSAVNGAAKTQKVAGSTPPPAPSSRPSSRPIRTARSPTCSCRAASSTSAERSPRSRSCPRTLLAALNPTTGARQRNSRSLIRDTWNGGTMGSSTSTSTDDGTTLVAIGNFRNVNGQSRPQIAMADLSDERHAGGWPTGRPRYTTQCAGVFETYMRDVDIAPNGKYFAVVATGAAGGVNSGTLCDTASRWEIGPTSAARPDLGRVQRRRHLHPVEATGPAIYVGGHFRWMNNPYNADSAGQGAVGRGVWRPWTRATACRSPGTPVATRGVGVWEFLPTATGLWVGHDTNSTGGEARKRIALFPLAGGTQLALENTGSLPGDLFLLGQPAGAASAHWVARVNTGGGTLLASDNGPDWSADTGDQPSPYRNGNANAADWGNLAITRGGALPATAPTALFNSELWSPNDSPNLQWDFAAPAGHHLQVRLYFSNGYDGTASPGQRVFDVAVDGTTVLDDYDIAADVGNHTGTMKSFDITSDGNVDIDFQHVAENPLVNGIEIIDSDVAPTQSTDDMLSDGRSMARPRAPRRSSARRAPIGAPPAGSSRSRACSTAARPTGSSMRGPSTVRASVPRSRSTSTG